MFAEASLFSMFMWIGLLRGGLSPSLGWPQQHASLRGGQRENGSIESSDTWDHTVARTQRRGQSGKADSLSGKRQP